MDKTTENMLQMARVSSLSHRNALDYLQFATQLAQASKFGHGYAMLTLALEEAAKSQVCRFYLVQNGLEEKGLLKKGAGISKTKIERIFWDHEAKRLTVATQLVLWLVNYQGKIFSQAQRELAFEAIKSGKREKSKELNKLLETIKKMDELRDRSFYVEEDTSGPHSITKNDFTELELITRAYLENLGNFTLNQTEPYAFFEDKVKKLMK